MIWIANLTVHSVLRLLIGGLLTTLLLIVALRLIGQTLFEHIGGWTYARAQSGGRQ